MKTSVTDPIRVDFLPQRCLRGRGRLGLTIAPGKKDRSGSWNRDLDADLARLRGTYEATVLVSLMEEHEYEMLGIASLHERARALGFTVHSFPIRDVSRPKPTETDPFRALVEEVVAAIDAGATVVVHCRGGLGRSGLFAASVLNHCGMSADEAIAATRTARPGAIETMDQEEWVRLFSRGAREAGRAKRSLVSEVAPSELAPRESSIGDVPRDRVLGCLLGGALGDALGYPVEFIPSAEDIARRFGASPPAELAYAEPSSIGLVSDDTQMTLFVAEGIIRAQQRFETKGICNPHEVGLRALMRWYVTQTGGRVDEGTAGWLVRDRRLYARRAPGNTIMSALRAHAASGGEHSLRARNDSKGCGSVMRAAPFGFLASPEIAFEHAVENARLTHGHPTAALSAGYLAVLVWALARGAGVQDALATADDVLSGKAGREETVAAVRAARDAGDDRASTLEQLGGGWVAEEALAIGIACLLAFDPATPGAVERTLWRAACHGGDSDSTASITGNLVGAMVGTDALPAAWLRDLELRDAIERVGGDLWSALFRGELLDTDDYPPL